VLIETTKAIFNNRRRVKFVLKEAQELGYAEADPTFDVEGIDAAHKLAILAMLAIFNGCYYQFFG
jgi:homoserine dehydrogenase